jgi:glycosyltransferase involved in cell wall biosynthesis
MINEKLIYLQITPYFPSADNYVGSYIFDQVEAIKKNSSYEVIVIKLCAPHDYIKDNSYIHYGTKVFNFKVIDFPSSILPGVFQYLNFFRIRKFIKDIIKINMSRVRIIHAHSVYPAGMLSQALSKKYNIPYFVQYHGLDTLNITNGRVLSGKFKDMNNSYMKKLYKEIVDEANLNIGVSQKVINELYNQSKTSNNNFYILYNGVDPVKFYKIQGKYIRNIYTIGCIGNFIEIKGQIILLKALDLIAKQGLEQIKLKFIGTGPNLSICKKYVKDHNLELYVEFLSEIDHSKLNNFYSGIDLFILPSYYEALGCVYMEALHIGLPIIAIKGQGIEELLCRSDRGLMLIDKNDYRGLAVKIETIKSLNNFNKYNFDIDIYIKKYLVHIKAKFNV